MKSSLRLATALVAAVSLAVTGLACGGDDGGGGDSGEAKALLERAFEKQVDSGDLKIDVKADLESSEDRLDKPIALRLDGPYESAGRTKPPRLDWDIAFKGLGLDVKGGLIATADNAYAELQGQAYEVGTETFSSLARQYAGLQPDRPQKLGTLGVDPTSWLKDPEIDEDGGSIGGDATRKITGSVDVRKVTEDIVDLVRSPRLRRQLERQGQPTPKVSPPSEEELDELENAVEEFDIEVNVDENDVVRRFFTEFRFDVPDDKEKDLRGGKVSLSYVLRKVNTDQVIRAPQNPKPLGELLQGFGLGSLGGGGGP